MDRLLARCLVCFGQLLPLLVALRVQHVSFGVSDGVES